MKKTVTIIAAILVFLLAFIGVSSIDFGKKSGADEPNFVVDNKESIKSTEIDFRAEFGNKTMYYYNSLNEEMKEQYLLIYQAVKNFEPTCTLISSQQLADKAYVAVYSDNPELYWMSNNYKYSENKKRVVISLEYKYSKEEWQNNQKVIDKKLNEVIALAEKYNTPFEKEKFFHDYICLNTVYDEATLGTYGGLAYHTLIEGKAVCEGYARAMQLLLNKAGISNYLITGDATSDGSTEPHMWNIVTIDNKNYHLDVTWDDADEDSGINYMYFNITDSDILTDHSKLYPENNNCVYIDENYFVKNNRYITSFNGYDQLKDVTADVLKTGENYVEFRFESRADYNKAVSVLENDNRFFNFVRDAVKQSGRNLSRDSIQYINADEFNYLCLVFVEE